MQKDFLSDEDLQRLERGRMRRFNECVRFQGIVYLDLEYCLHLTCMDDASTSAALSNLELLRFSAWMVLGVEDLIVWRNGKVIWIGDTRSDCDFLLESELFEEVAMAATTLDRGKVEALAVEQFQSEVLAPEIEAIADDAVSQYLNSGEFEQYARSQLGQYVERWRNLMRKASVTNGATVAVAVEAPTAEPEAPFKLANNHAVTLFNAVSALIEDSKEQVGMLRQMRRGTKKGKEFADRIAEFCPEPRRAKVREAILQSSVIDKVIVRLNK